MTEGEKVIGADREVDSMSPTIFGVYNFKFRVDPTPTVPGPITLHLYVSPLMKGGEITVELTEIEHLISAGSSKISAHADLSDTVRFSIPLVIPPNDTSGISIEIRTNDSMLYIDKFYWVSDENMAGLYRGNPRLFPSAHPPREQKIIKAGEPWDTAAYIELQKNKIYGASMGGRDPLGERSRAGKDIVISASVEPFPIRPGPNTLYLKVFPQLNANRKIKIEIIEINGLEYNGPMILLEEAVPFDTAEFRLSVEVPTNNNAFMIIGVTNEEVCDGLCCFWLIENKEVQFSWRLNVDIKAHRAKQEAIRRFEAKRD